MTHSREQETNSPEALARMADNLRRLYSGESYEAVYGIPYGGGGCQQVAEHALIDAYLAEHPADDAELVDQEFLHTLPYLCVKMIPEIEAEFAITTHLSIVLRRLSPGEWAAVLRDQGDRIALGTIPTRGHLRRLATALGVELKG